MTDTSQTATPAQSQTDASHTQPQNQAPNTAPVICGLLEGFWETGTEGVLWALEEEPFKGYDGLHILENGDELTVFNADGSVLWKGVIDLEYESGYMNFPLNPQYGQQAALGYWVHGCQRGFAIDDWAYMFMGPHCRNPRYPQRLKGELRKGPGQAALAAQDQPQDQPQMDSDDEPQAAPDAPASEPQK
jgi:hypothetical protein